MYLNAALDAIETLYFLQIKTGKRFSVELVSGPGMGKSEGVTQLAQRIARKLMAKMGVKPFFLTTVEPPDVRGFGLPGRDAEGAAIMQFTRAPWMPKAGDPEHGFVFLDEFGQAAQDVAKPAAELLLNGRVGESELPITWMVIAASNREKDRSGVGRSLAFIDNRKLVLHIEPNLDVWVEWAEREGINPFAISFAKSHPGLIFQDHVPDKPGPFGSPRTLVKTSYMVGQMPMEMLTECAAGYMGQGTGAEFIAHLRVAEELPPFEDIVANPTKTRVPDRQDAVYACMSMVAHRVDAKNAAPCFVYLKRMGKEYQVAGLKAVLRRAPQMVQTPDFALWLRENKDLVMAANILDRR